MAARLLHSLADDNPDLQNQIGCMTGMFQLFDRPQMVTERRLKRLPADDSNGGISGRVASNTHHWHTSVHKSLNDKQRLSGPSDSSSSSSISSLDCDRAAQPEDTSSGRIVFPETPSGDTITTRPTSSQYGQQSRKFQDGVTKTTTKEVVVGHALRHKNSSRPMQLSKSSEGSLKYGSNGKHNEPTDFSESLMALAKLREASLYHNEPAELPRSSYEARDGFWLPTSKDGSQFYCDGREANRLSFESGDAIKSNLKLKEVPRLSLDSKEISTRGFNSNLKLNCTSSTDTVNVPEQSLDNHRRLPSVIAKLMGLEALPDSTPTNYRQSGAVKSLPTEGGDLSFRSFGPNDVRRIRMPKSPRSSGKEPTSPRWKNLDLVMKPLSKLPIEPAPWKQLDGSRNSQKQALKPAKGPAKMQNSFPSVYSEIEKRLKDLDFTQSQKDLRALKQIVEAMQDKGLQDSKKEDQGSNFESQQDYEPKAKSPKQKPRLQGQNQETNRVNASINRVPNSQRTYETPIVIMKPARQHEESNVFPTSAVISADGLPSLRRTIKNGYTRSKTRSITNQRVIDQSSRNSGSKDFAVISSDKKTNIKNTKPTHLTSRSQKSPKENTILPTKSSASVSPRPQQKKFEVEKRSLPPTGPSDSSKLRRQTNKKPAESSSSVKHKLEFNKSPPNDDQLSHTSNDSRTSSQQREDSSPLSNNIVVFDQKIDVEVTGSEKVIRLSKLDAGGSMLSEGNVFGLEHPSPISVLDFSLYGDDALSPVKPMPSTAKEVTFQGYGNQKSDCQLNPEDKLAMKPTLSGITSGINRKKLQSVENLVQKLQRLNSTHDESGTDYIASLCENTSPDNRYISEILLTSGILLRDIGSGQTEFQLHTSGHPINPQLFLVLEQTKGSNLLINEDCIERQSNPEKLHRKLLFDAVNEILTSKLASLNPLLDPCFKSSKLTTKTLSTQKLLKELCFEIEQLQVKSLAECSLDDKEDGLKVILIEDVMHRSESWTEYHIEMSGIILDIERWIFRDLMNEIVMSQATILPKNPVRRRRQLFAE